MNTFVSECVNITMVMYMLFNLFFNLKTGFKFKVNLVKSVTLYNWGIKSDTEKIALVYLQKDK